MGVDRMAGQHLQPFGRFVGEQFQEWRRRGKMGLDVRHVGVEAGEDEAVVARHMRHRSQAVVLALPAFRVGAIGLVLHVEQLPAVVIDPSMVRTNPALGAAARLAADHGATVRTGIDEAAQDAVGAAADDHGLASDDGGQIVVRIGNLAVVADIDPGAFPNVPELLLEDVRIGIERAVDLEGLTGPVDDAPGDVFDVHGFPADCCEKAHRTERHAGTVPEHSTSRRNARRPGHAGRQPVKAR